MPERIFSEGIVLPDGRKVRVLAYDDRSVRIRLDGTPYVLEEAFLSGGRQDHAIVKLAPRSAANVAADLEEQGADPLLLLRSRINAIKDQLEQLPEQVGPGRIVTRHWREGMDHTLTLIGIMIDSLSEAGDDE